MKSRTLLRLNAVLLGIRAALGLFSPLQVPKMLLHQKPHLSADRAEPILPFLLTVLTPVGRRLRLFGKGGGIQLNFAAGGAGIQVYLILVGQQGPQTASAVGSNGEILQFTFHRRPTAWTVPDAYLFHIVLLAAHRVRRNQHTYWMVTNRAMSSFMAMAAFLAASWKSCPSPPVFFQAHIMPREELTMAP